MSLDIGTKLKIKMIEGGVTCTELADYLRVNVRTVYNMRSGFTEISLKTLKKICKKLNCASTYFLEI